MLNLILFQVLRLPDGGGFYAETNTAYWIVEPWNAISSLSFWLPVAYWFWKIKGRYRDYGFLSACLPLLFLGGLGSALFHAFRSSPILLMMDVLPIMALTIAFSLYLWLQILDWWWVLVVLLVYFLIQVFVFHFFNAQSINIGYFMRGVMMFLPAVLLLQGLRYRYANYLFWGGFYFALALLFRFLDKDFTPIMYMGSHWLWHISTAVGAYYLGSFLYNYASLRNEEQQLSYNKDGKKLPQSLPSIKPEEL